MASTTGPLLNTVRAFAFPRHAGSSAEMEASERVERRFRELGLTVETERFQACREVVPRLRKRVHWGIALASLGMGFGGLWNPVITATLGVAVMALVAASRHWSPQIEAEFDAEPKINSRNVTARRRVAHESPVRIVLMAHVDSKSSRYSTAVAVSMTVLAISIVCGLMLWGLFATFKGWGGGSPESLIPLSVIAAILLAIAGDNPDGNESPGAMDNASGIAVLLGAAETLPQDPSLANIEFQFVATGAEEIGLAGAVRWFAAHSEEFDRRRTIFLNVDSVGDGRGLMAMDVNGVSPCGRSMRSMLRAVSRSTGVLRVTPFLPSVGVDTMPMSARGWTTASLIDSAIGRVGARIHTRRDTMGPLREEALENALSVVHEIAREIARREPPSASE